MFAKGEAIVTARQRVLISIFLASSSSFLKFYSEIPALVCFLPVINYQLQNRRFATVPTTVGFLLPVIFSHSCWCIYIDFH